MSYSEVSPSSQTSSATPHSSDFGTFSGRVRMFPNMKIRVELLKSRRQVGRVRSWESEIALVKSCIIMHVIIESWAFIWCLRDYLPLCFVPHAGPIFRASKGYNYGARSVLAKALSSIWGLHLGERLNLWYDPIAGIGLKKTWNSVSGSQNKKSIFLISENQVFVNKIFVFLDIKTYNFHC